MTARSGTDFTAFPTVASRGSSKKNNSCFVFDGLRGWLGVWRPAPPRDDSIRFDPQDATPWICAAGRAETDFANARELTSRDTSNTRTDSEAAARDSAPPVR